MRLAITLIVDIDEEAYATDYGLTAAQVPADAKEHVQALVIDAVETPFRTLGYPQVVASSSAITEPNPRDRCRYRYQPGAEECYVARGDHFAITAHDFTKE